MTSTDTSKFLVSEAHLLLDEARRKKAEQTKDVGDPIQLQGKALDLTIKDGVAWIAENTAVVRKLDLETGKTLQLFKGHTGPLTCLTFCDRVLGSGDQKILITGSWDKTIKLWDTETKSLLSSTDAHEDFVKSLFVFPSLGLLVSGSSDKIVRFWDISSPLEEKPLTSIGSISSHTRPVESLQGKVISDHTAVLYTADTMGVIKIWDLTKETGPNPHWKASLKLQLDYHRTKINEMVYGNGQLWTASADESVQVYLDPDVSSETKVKAPPSIVHPKPVRCLLPVALTDVGEPYLITGHGDVIRVYDLTTFDEPEIVREVGAHWHDVTALRLWIRKTVGDDGRTRIEPWIVSTSLDETIRRWRLAEMVIPPPPETKIQKPSIPPPALKERSKDFEMTEEEERELAELMGED